VPRLSAYRSVWDREIFDAATPVKTKFSLERTRALGTIPHGWEGTRSEYTTLAEDLASRGYEFLG